ncbi:MAG: RsmB/NOP family class I SAM-dependent RNA methyltransferase [Alphaproteobacteria bacterium]|nr:RsmB/NOP family class I SAM-dependent RNA methyltransferase [Alphaproteobacteria bacterium]MBV9554931.1 RsmB/NOP family class I SAM-dependent RNA methyltransferase [Alphaproteobacteria bacterium]
MVPAATARHVALDLIGAVLGRERPLDEAIDDSAGMATLSLRDRAFARLLVATVLRRLGQIDALIGSCLANPLPPRAAQVHDILRLGIAQLLFLHTPAHAAVATSVDLAQGRGFPAHKGLVNAVLRRLSVEGPERAATQDAPLLNTPGWLWESWARQYGSETARAIATAHLREAPLDLTLRGDASGWCETLAATRLPTGTLRRPGGGAVAMLPGYAEGVWWVQDAAAALPVRLFGNVAGLQIIDMCAAPGGKTAQLADGGAFVTAVDRSTRRLERLSANLKRLSLTAAAVAADAVTWRPEQPADAVLLDAPCSATGAIRRHPDVPHLKRPADIARLAAIQDRLLHAAVEMLRPGGTLVYCTCSLEAEEGPCRVAALLGSGVPIERQPITGDECDIPQDWVTAEGDLRTLPFHLAEHDGIDGFYGARLVKRAEAA